jgi:hypothetical protein
MDRELDFDSWQFEKYEKRNDLGELRGVIDGDELGDGYQIAKERRIKHGVPDWVMTWHGFARVCILCGGVEVKTRRAGKPVNPARRASILYLYFVIGLSDSHIAESLNVSKTYIKYLVQDVRKRYSGLDPEISPDMEAQIKASIRTVMSGRPEPVVMPKTEDEQEKQAEREIEAEEWENIRQEMLVRLGASRRERRRSELPLSRPVRWYLSRLKVASPELYRRREKIIERPPQRARRVFTAKNGKRIPPVDPLWSEVARANRSEISKAKSGAPSPAAGSRKRECLQTIYEETRAGKHSPVETIYGEAWVAQESDIFKPIPSNPL